MQWRLTLDVPYSFPIEQGVRQSYHSTDFRPEAGSKSNAIWNPATGLVMLRPNFYDKSLYTDFKDLSNFRANTDRWAQVKKSQDLINAFTTQQPSGADPALIEISVAVAIVAITSGQMKWCLESKFNLEIDEGFSLELNGLSDEMQRDEDWFCVQWDNILIHFGCTGHARVYKWAARSDLTVTPSLVYEFDYAEPSQLLHRHCHFRFLPVPSRGLLLQLSHIPPQHNVSASNTNASAKHGLVIPWDSYMHGTGDGIVHLFERSPVRIGFNPYKHTVVGYQAMRFAASGYYIDAVRDPQYKPVNNPSLVSAQVLPTIKQTVTAALQNETNTGTWTAGTDQRYRNKLTLTTDDTRYTPFVTGYGAFWDPVFATRNTTPVVLSNTAGGGDTLTELEFTQDCMGRFEGKFTANISSAAGKAIAERGDSTWLLENRATSGDAWATVEGGLAVDWNYEVSYAAQQDYYTVTASLRDFYHRFEECHVGSLQSAADTLTVGQSINNVLQCSGFPPLTTMPTFATQIKVPGQVGNEQWSHSAHLGDSADRVLSNYLLFLRGQKSEWRLRWDWANNTFVLEKRARDETNYWTLKPARADENAGSRIWSYSSATVKPESPEGNVVCCEGMTAVTPQGYRARSAVLVNPDSINNTSSVDFLGRPKRLAAVFNPLTSTTDLDLMVRRVYDAVAHRRQYCEACEVPSIQMSLVPNTRVKLFNVAGATILDGWITKRTITVDMFDKETMTLCIDSVWESPI